MESTQLWLPYCGAAPAPEVWLGRWNLDPVLGSVLMLLAAVLWRASPGQDRPGRQRHRALWWAWGLAVLLFVSPLCALGSALFTVRVVHDMVLVFVMAPLFAHGLAPRLERLPLPLWTCTASATAAFWAWHAPAPYAAALSSSPIFALMQLTLLGSALAFWLAVKRARPAWALGAILASTVQMGLLGALITFAVRPLYAPHFASTLSWGVAPLEDQQLAGIVMWAPGSIAYLAAALWIGWHWLRQGRERGVEAGAA